MRAGTGNGGGHMVKSHHNGSKRAATQSPVQAIGPTQTRIPAHTDKYFHITRAGRGSKSGKGSKKTYGVDTCTGAGRRANSSVRAPLVYPFRSTRMCSWHLSTSSHNSTVLRHTHTIRIKIGPVGRVGRLGVREKKRKKRAEVAPPLRLSGHALVKSSRFRS